MIKTKQQNITSASLSSTKRIGQYLRRWLLGGAIIFLSVVTTNAAYAVNCGSVRADNDGWHNNSAVNPRSATPGWNGHSPFQVCGCMTSKGWLTSQTKQYNVNTGAVIANSTHHKIAYCADQFDTACSASQPTALVDKKTYYFKNTTEKSQYYKCTWLLGQG